MTPAATHDAKGVRIVAAFEAVKGLLVVLTGFGLLALLHRDLQALGAELVEHLHMNPASRYPHIFLNALSALTDARLWQLAGAALAYALLRFAEAWGLWRERRWAEWLAVASGAIYLPFEVIELARGVSVLKLATFAANLAILLYMGAVLRRRLRREKLPAAGPTEAAVPVQPDRVAKP